MTASGGDSRGVDLAAIAAHGRRLVRRARLWAAATAVAAGVLVAGIGVGARAVVHSADAGDGPAPTSTIPTTTETTGPTAPLLEVPNVVGETEGDATRILEGAGLGVATESLDAEGVERGVVLEQNPAAHTEVPAGATVTLSVSTGPDLVTVPVVDGRAEPDARSILEAVGFEVVSVAGEESEQVPEGIVLRTMPAGGTDVPAGSGVALVVSSGPPPPVVD